MHFGASCYEGINLVPAKQIIEEGYHSADISIALDLKNHFANTSLVAFIGQYKAIFQSNPCGVALKYLPFPGLIGTDQQVPFAQLLDS